LVPRDSFFGERIIWQGHPEVIKPPGFLRALSGVAWATALVGICFAASIALTLGVPEALPLGLFSAWCIALAVALVQLPQRWARSARYVVTDAHVVVKYGPFTRTIERGAISFARIYWNEDVPNTGDLEVIRAVPTGALRRRLGLRLSGLVAPDRVWAIVRGAEALAPAGQGERPVGQRLDHGEHVIWSAQRRPLWNAYLPRGQREWMLLVLAVFLLGVVGRMLMRGVPVLERVATGALPMRTVSFVALALGMGVAVLLMLAIAGYLAYDAVLRPGLLARQTRYLVTNKRVLIQRRGEELHLDRRRIIDVIDAPGGDGLRDVFMVLDGPRARAVAASGAFGEMGRGPHLRPVFESVEDAEGVSRILRDNGELPEAA